RALSEHKTLSISWSHYRQYLPKGIDLNQADQHYLNQVAMSLNTRPRKALDWLTPLEKFAQLVDYHMAFETVAPHV
ncbi:hypothetical protein MMF11_004516, partial [Enterobacter hormaechei]|nr:hypothetical protein [Enterobacter hormaechei]